MTIDSTQNITKNTLQSVYIKGQEEDAKTQKVDHKKAQKSVSNLTRQHKTHRPSLSPRSSSALSDVSYGDIGKAMLSIASSEGLIDEALIQIFQEALREYNLDRKDVINTANNVFQDRLNEAEDIKDEGFALMAGGLINSSAQMLGGASAFVGAGVGDTETNSAWGNMTKGQAIGQIIQGAGSSAKSDVDGLEKTYESKAKTEEGSAAKESAYSDAVKSIFEEEKQLQADILQSLSQIEQTQYDTATAVISKV